MYLSLYCKGSKRVPQGFTARGSWRLNKDCNILTLILWPSVLWLSRSPDAQPEVRGLSFVLSAGFLYHILSPTGLQNYWGPRGPLLLDGGFPYHILSPTRLISNSWLPVSPSYIIVQSPTQSLEWHVWSSSSGNNCHALHRSLSSGASVYECIMDFYLVPFRQPNPPTQFFRLLAIGMCRFLPVHHFRMTWWAGSKVNIPHILLRQCNAVYNQNTIDRCILPFPKKVYSRLAKNFRSITLTSLAAKIYNDLIRNCITPKIKKIPRKNQSCFRRNWSMTSQILTIRRILEGVRAKNIEATILFVDFFKAFEGRWGTYKSLTAYLNNQLQR